MSVMRYMSHPEVVIDPAVPVPEWGLTATGRARTVAMCDQPWMGSIRRIVASAETKALEAAGIVAEHLGLPVDVRPETGETDRSSTGFLPAEAYQEVSDRFFADPDRSADGWETARALQERVRAALDDVLHADRDVLVVGHGGAGTVLYCLLAGIAIAADRDQPGPGHYFTVDLTTRRPLHPWHPIDDVTP